MQAIGTSPCTMWPPARNIGQEPRMNINILFLCLRIPHYVVNIVSIHFLGSNTWDQPENLDQTTYWQSPLTVNTSYFPMKGPPWVLGPGDSEMKPSAPIAETQTAGNWGGWETRVYFDICCSWNLGFFLMNFGERCPSWICSKPFLNLCHKMVLPFSDYMEWRQPDMRFNGEPDIKPGYSTSPVIVFL